MFNVKIINKNLEKNVDKCVVFSNHICFADPIILFADIKKIAIMGKAELFKNKILGKCFSFFGIFPINRGAKDAKSIIHAVNVLKGEKFNKLLIFPEGTRIKNEVRVPVKIGAVYVAIKANVPILPVRIIKKHPNRKIFTSMTIIYDTPIYLDNTRIKDKEYLQEMSNKVMDVIYNLEEK
ncbi:MAG: lysophospholipid acyltransferase family protein [Clostridia bacterium]